MKINRARQQESVAVFGRETSLIRDVLDNLELEHALTWLLEAISQHQSGKMGGEPWHLYQTTLFAMYVDYDNGKVRLSAALACHDADLEMSLKDFVEILSREAVKEAAPLHYTPGSSGKCIHRYRNPYFKRRRRDREPDIGFTPETDFAAKWHPILSKRPDSLWTPAFFHFFGRAFHKWTRETGQGKKCGFYSAFEMNIDPVSSRS